MPSSGRSSSKCSKPGALSTDALAGGEALLERGTGALGHGQDVDRDVAHAPSLAGVWRTRTRGTVEEVTSALALDADPGLFGPDSITWRVHADPSMALAGLRALLLQAVHPLAMAGVAAAQRLPQGPLGPAVPDRRLRRRHHLRHDAGGAHRRRQGPRHPREAVRRRAGERHAPTGSATPSCCAGCTASRSSRSCRPRCAAACGSPARSRTATTASRRCRPRSSGSTPTTSRAAWTRSRSTSPRCGRSCGVDGRGPPRGAVRAVAADAVAGAARDARPARPGSPSPPPPSRCSRRWARRLYSLPGIPTTDLAATAAGIAFRTGVLVVPQGLRQGPHVRRGQGAAGPDLTPLKPGRRPPRRRSTR